MGSLLISFFYPPQTIRHISRCQIFYVLRTEMLDIREKNINKFFFIARFFVKRIFCTYERESLRTQKLLQIIWYLLTWPILSGKQKRRCYEPIFLDYCLGMFHDSEIKCKSMSFLELTRILGSCCISKYVKVKDKTQVGFEPFFFFFFFFFWETSGFWICMSLVDVKYDRFPSWICMVPSCVF